MSAAFANQRPRCIENYRPSFFHVNRSERWEQPFVIHTLATFFLYLPYIAYRAQRPGMYLSPTYCIPFVCSGYLELEDAVSRILGHLVGICILYPLYHFSLPSCIINYCPLDFINYHCYGFSTTASNSTLSSESLTSGKMWFDDVALQIDESLYSWRQLSHCLTENASYVFIYWFFIHFPCLVLEIVWSLKLQYRLAVELALSVSGEVGET